MEKILVIEDDESLARGIQFALERENYVIQLAGTVNEGLESFRKESFNLILLDVMLPDGNGFDMCKVIRETSKVPIIFLTACDEEVNVVLGLDLGADDYITKPFRIRELVSRIRAALRRMPEGNTFQASGAVIKSEKITLHQLDRKLIKNGVEILLTPTEYKLISIFIQNPLQVLNRNQILDKLWDVDGEFVDDNTLSVYIRRIREKIEDDSASPKYIITVRGFGYKWNQKSE